jgi:thiol-disulfide isomerase/thioredoxin
MSILRLLLCISLLCCCLKSNAQESDVIHLIFSLLPGEQIGIEYNDHVNEYFCISVQEASKATKVEKRIYTRNPIWITQKDYTRIPFLLFPGQTYVISKNGDAKHLLTVNSKDSMANNALRFFPTLYTWQRKPTTQSEYLRIKKSYLDKYIPDLNAWDAYFDSAYRSDMLFLENYTLRFPIGAEQQKAFSSYLFYNYFTEKFKMERRAANHAPVYDNLHKLLLVQLKDFESNLSCDSCIDLPAYRNCIDQHIDLNAKGDESFRIKHQIAEHKFTGKTLHLALFGLGKAAIYKNDTGYLRYLLSKTAVDVSFDTLYTQYLLQNSDFRNMRVKDNSGYLLTNAKQKVLLDSILQQPSVVYIDFWASWCAPCQEEIPNTLKLAKHFEGTRVKVIILSIDENITSWSAASQTLMLDKFSQNYLAIQLPKLFLQKIKNGIPWYIIIKNGKIVNDNAPSPGSPQTKKLLETFGKK